MVVVEWKNEEFTGIDSKGNVVKLAGKNISPMEMVLIALAGCTAIDVVEILKKMRKNLESLRVQVEGERNEEYPKYWKKAKIFYEIKGSDITEEDVEKAIKLSMTTYCSVAATISGKTEISYSFRVIK
ncbi:MAG TPA: OsmC family protein [Geobacterales bacterium]|nr:OsmC family protein [Geobacterales bacterium]